MDEEAQAEMWVRKKPKRIVHNAWLIQLLIILNIALPIPVAGIVFWLAFSFYPAIVVPGIIVAWVLGSIIYVILDLLGRKKKEVNRGVV